MIEIVPSLSAAADPMRHYALGMIGIRGVGVDQMPHRVTVEVRQQPFTNATVKLNAGGTELSNLLFLDIDSTL